MGLRGKRLWLVVAAVSFTMLMALLVVSWRVLPGDAIERPAGGSGFDVAQAIREHEDWFLQTAISYESAVQILGGNPPGGHQTRVRGTDGPLGLVPLGTGYYLFPPSTTASPTTRKVVQIWYRRNSSVPQYVVILQGSEQAYVDALPHHLGRPSFHPQITTYLNDGTPLWMLFSSQTEDGTLFIPEWLQHRWTIEWVSQGVRHHVLGVNLNREDIVRIAEQFLH